MTATILQPCVLVMTIFIWLHMVYHHHFQQQTDNLPSLAYYLNYFEIECRRYLSVKDLELRCDQFSKKAAEPFRFEYAWYYVNRNFKMNESSVLLFMLRNFSLRSINQPIMLNFSINEFDLAFNDLSCISNVAFRNFLSLKNLNVNQNNLENIDFLCSSIPLKSYEKLDGWMKNLKILDLTYNKIVVIKADAFWCLPNLENLDLSRNRLKKLENNCFAGLSKVDFLKIGVNQIPEITSDEYFNLFNDLKMLQSLVLYYNNITRLTTRSFRFTAPNLRRLLLSENNLEYIEPFTFACLDSLTSLSLVNNRLMLIEPYTFYGLGMLDSLYLYGNNIVQFKDNSFNSLLSVNWIQFDIDDTSKLDDTIFDQNAFNNSHFDEIIFALKSFTYYGSFFNKPFSEYNQTRKGLSRELRDRSIKLKMFLDNFKLKIRQQLEKSFGNFIFYRTTKISFSLSQNLARFFANFTNSSFEMTLLDDLQNCRLFFEFLKLNLHYLIYSEGQFTLFESLCFNPKFGLL